MRLTDIAPQELWDEMRAEKMLNVQTHPRLPLCIYNYSQNAQFTKTWNAVTLASRGLIVNAAGEIVARPFSKFFNYSELDEAAASELTGQAVVSDKLDGSLGIGYVNPETGEMNIATRGSFASDQALHATKLYKSRYEGNWNPLEGETYLWEIIYPDNRIVLNYDGLDDLVLIGRVNNATGRSAIFNEITEWPWKRAEVFPYGSLEDALKASPRENAEGLVVHFPDTDVRVKLKQEDYVRLHRIVTNVTTLRIWEILRQGISLEDWLRETPEEFYKSVKSEADELLKAKADLLAKAKTTIEEVKDHVKANNDEFTRKAFALRLNEIKPDSTVKALAFPLLDNDSERIETALWRAIRPSAS